MNRALCDTVGNTVCIRGTKKLDGRKTGGAALSLPKIRRNPLIEIIAINTGSDCGDLFVLMS